METATGGVVLVDKPAGPTSHDIVQRVRRLAHTRRVGHAGTLDPAATGLLLIGIGPATRLLTYLTGLGKTYEATIRLGFATTTDDAEGTPIGEAAPVGADVLAAVDGGVARLTGEIEQVPSSVSAVHVAGRRAHELVREGVAVDIPARRVVVERFEVVARRGEELDVVVDCSSGTYIRALARDLGAALGVGGHLTSLRRTRIGPFRVADAPALEPLAPLSPAEAAARVFPTVRLPHEAAVALQQGKRPAVDGLPEAEVVAALDSAGRLLGLAAPENGRLRVLLNLPAPEAAA